MLVRLHGEPLGLVHVDLTVGDLSSGSLADQIWLEMDTAITRHLEDDGSEPAATLESTGLGADPHPPPCVASTAGEDLGVTVVVTTAGDPRRLERCLAGLARTTHPHFEVLVADQQPSDGRTAALVDQRRSQDTRIRYLPTPTRSRSVARNVAFGRSRQELVAFTDDSCIPDDGWVAAVAASFARNPGAVCTVGPVLAHQLETAPQQAHEAASAVTGGWQARVFDRSGPVSGPPEPPFLAGLYGWGNNLAVRKDLLDDLWGFDPHLGPGTPAGAADDLDVLIGALAAGHQVAFEPRALVWREHPDDVATVQARLREREVALGAMLAKQVVSGRLPPRDLLLRLPQGPNGERSGGTPQGMSHLATGVWAYARSRLHESWATA